MKRLPCLLLLVCMLGCDTGLKIDLGDGFGLVRPSAPTRPEFKYPEYELELPTVNLEQVFRQQNWPGSEGGGSCVHATMVMLFRWQGREDLATKWLDTYENGEWAIGLAEKLDKEGVRYAYTCKEKDVRFLEWACNTRRGCGVSVMSGAHMVMLVHLDHEWAGLLDNNFPEEITWVPRATFLSDWDRSDSWAVTPVYTPPPPLPSEDEIE